MMNSPERMPDFGSDREATPEMALEDLIHRAEVRYYEALTRRQETPGVLWLASERLEGTDGGPDEQVMWFRLAAEPELRPDVEQFDVGITVVDPDEPNPRPELQDPTKRHFYVRKWERYERRQKISLANAQEVSGQPRLLAHRSLVYGLPEKLRDYTLHNIRMWTPPPDSFGNDVA